MERKIKVCESGLCLPKLISTRAHCSRLAALACLFPPLYSSLELAVHHDELDIIMVGTRRKTKTSAATDDDDPNAFTVVIPDDLDVDYFAENLPELNLSSPSPDAILALYQLLAAQASDIDTAQRDLDEARAEAEKKDVELDQALQDRERSTNDLESQVNGLQDELKQVKEEREHLSTFIVF